MTAEERTQIQIAIRKTPKTIWSYWPFLLPLIVVVVGAAVQIGLVIYFQHKFPDLEVLFKYGKVIQPVWDSELVRQAVLATSGSIIATFLMFIYLARLAFKQINLLKIVAKDLGIDESQEISD